MWKKRKKQKTLIASKIYPEFIPLVKDLGEDLFQHLLITSVWVFLPSTTMSQLEPIITGNPPIDSYLTDSIIKEERQYYYSERNIVNGGFLEIIPEKDNIFTYKYSFIDNKIHACNEGLVTIYEEIKINLQLALKGYMNKLPVKSMVILFSDHGFVKKKASPGTFVKTGLYSHGRTSPWEMIVPAVILYRWM